MQAAQWKEFVAQEAQSALAGGQRGKLRADPADRARALRFYKWVGNWLVRITDREQALEVASDSLELVADDDHACLEFAHWAMDAKMPELVIALAKKYPHHFESKPSLGYLLAESYLDTGDEQTAQAFAVAASDQIEREAEKARRIPSANIKDAIASRRIDMAMVDLSSRGMFDWAEAELKRAVELETSPNINAEARSELAAFYWAADKNREAAEVLEPLLDLPADRVRDELPGRRSNQGQLHCSLQLLSWPGCNSGWRQAAGWQITTQGNRIRRQSRCDHCPQVDSQRRALQVEFSREI